MCWCHTGLWDFGHTGITITEAKSVYHENVTQNIFLANLFGLVKTDFVETTLDLLQK